MSTKTTQHEFPLFDKPATPLPSRPHGHVVGHAIGQPPTESFAGRPHGHVVGHAIGQRPAQPFAGHPERWAASRRRPATPSPVARTAYRWAA
jgi:hypothetical protein